MPQEFALSFNIRGCPLCRAPSFSIYIGKTEDFFVYNNVKFPWTVHICEVKCISSEATFLILLQSYFHNLLLHHNLPFLN